jgi:hypothetical protein
MSAAGAVALLPANSLQIPYNREFNREFCTFHPFWRKNGRISPAISASYSEIPYAGEQGIFSTRTGNFSPEQGINREFAKAPQTGAQWCQKLSLPVGPI